VQYAFGLALDRMTAFLSPTRGALLFALLSEASDSSHLVRGNCLRAAARGTAVATYGKREPCAKFSSWSARLPSSPVRGSSSTPVGSDLQPVVAPGSPSGMSVEREGHRPAGVFPMEVQVNDDHGRPTKDFDLVLRWRPAVNSPRTPMPHSTLSVVGSTVTATAVNPLGNRDYNNLDIVDFTWSGIYTNIFGLDRTFTKSGTIVFPALLIEPVGIPSRGTAPVKVLIYPALDALVVVDINRTAGFTFASPTVTIPAGQQSGTVNVTAPLLRCPTTPTAVPGDLCVSGQNDLRCGEIRDEFQRGWSQPLPPHPVRMTRRWQNPRTEVTRP